jgi:hypothetical protein
MGFIYITRRIARQAMLQLHFTVSHMLEQVEDRIFAFGETEGAGGDKHPGRWGWNKEEMRAN